MNRTEEMDVATWVICDCDIYCELVDLSKMYKFNQKYE